MILEVIATNLTDVITAEQSGADRIELVTGIAEGGLTPSLGLIEAAVQAVSIPVNVMVRPHSQSFVYDRNDMQTMLADIRYIKRSGAAGIVIGTLTREREIDTELLVELLDEAEGLDVTFHRAFDEVKDQFKALQTFANFPQIRRVLTSGGLSPAPMAAHQIKKLVEASERTPIRILAGHGLQLESLEHFVRRTGVQEVHFGSAVRVDGSFLHPIDTDKIQAIQRILKHSRG